MIVTTSRADWNGLGMVAKSLAKHGAKVWVAAVYGHRAIAAIEEDGFDPALIGSAPLNDPMISAPASVMVALAEHIQAFRPDMALIVGDRHEMLIVAYTFAVKGIPLAHIAGGDVTGGSLDENWRHAISKIANVHFPTTLRSAERLLRMGERPEDVYMLGSPSIDRLRATPNIPRMELLEAVGMGARCGQFLLVNWQSEHPDNAGLGPMLEALSHQTMPVLFVGPNVDPHQDEIASTLQAAAYASERAVYRANLPPAQYLNCLRYAAALVGNSSSGYYEAPFYGTPVVNIGARQQGRDKPLCVHSVRPVATAIGKAIQEAVKAGRWPPEFLHGAGKSADPIAKTILSYSGRKSMRKQFYDD